MAEKRCPNCDRIIPADAPGGICPACALEDALDSNQAPTAMRPYDAERDLIFCMLGVQMDIVSSDVLMRVGVAWVSEPWGSLAERVQIAADIPAAKVALLWDLADAALRHRGAAVGRHTETRLSELISIAESIDDRAVRRTELGLPIALDDDFQSTPALHEQPGRYTRTSEYSRGGMGRILLVHDQYLSRDVALKELLPERLRDSYSPGGTPIRQASAMIARFLREAKVTGQLEHPNIVPVYELGQRENGTFYYTMKLIRGETMAAAMRKATTLAQRLRLLPNLIGLSHAVGYAHSRYVIHRDLKPGNIMIGPFGETVVIDWGLAKIVGQEDVVADDIAATLDSLHDQESIDDFQTKQGARLGTPAYMSPEQARGDIIAMDARSDVFSLGAILYELLTGHTPFDDKPYNHLLTYLATEKVPRPETLNQNIPPELANICAKAVSLGSSDRYANASEFAADLERFVSGALVTAHSYSFADKLRRFYERNKVAVQVAAVGATALLLLGVYSYIRIYQERDRAIEAQVIAEDALYRNGIKLAEQYLEHRNFDGAEQALTQLPENQRGWEWNYLSRASHGWTHTLEDARNIAWVPARNWFVTAGNEAPIQVYDADTFEKIKEIDSPIDVLNGIAVSPDGNRLALVGLRSFGVVLSLETSEHLYDLRGHTSDVLYEATFGKTGQRVVTRGNDGTCRIWNAANGDMLGTIQRPGYDVSKVSYCNNDQSIAAVFRSQRAVDAPHIVELYTVSDLTTVLETSGSSVEFDDLTQQAYVVSDNRVTVWDGTDGNPLRDWPLQENTVATTVLSEDGNLLATATDDGLITIYATPTGEVLSSAHLEGPVRAIRFSGDGTRFLTVPGRTVDDIRVWHAREGREILRLFGHSSLPLTGEFEPTGQRIATTGFDSVARVWSPQKWTATTTAVLTEPPPYRDAVKRSGDLLLLKSESGQYFTYDLVAGVFTNMLEAYADQDRTCGAIGPSGQSIAILADTTTPMIVRLDNPATPLLLRAHDAHVSALEYNATETMLYSAYEDGTVIGFSPSSGDTSSRIVLPNEIRPSVLAVSPNGCVAIGTQDGEVFLANATLSSIDDIVSNPSDVTALAFDPSNNLAIGWAGGEIARVDPRNPSSAVWAYPHRGLITGIAVDSVSDRLFVSTAEQGIALYRWSTLDHLTTLTSGSTRGVCFDIPKSICLSIDSSGALQAWNGRELSSEIAATNERSTFEQAVNAYVAEGSVTESIFSALMNQDRSYEIGDVHPFLQIGAHAGDRVLSLNGQTIDSDVDWREALATASTMPEASLRLSLRRGPVRLTYRWIVLPIETSSESVRVSSNDFLASIRQAIEQITHENPGPQLERLKALGIQSAPGELPKGYMVPPLFGSESTVYRILSIAPGDVIRKFDGIDINSYSALETALTDCLSRVTDSEVVIELDRGLLRKVTKTLVITD